MSIKKFLDFNFLRLSLSLMFCATAAAQPNTENIDVDDSTLYEAANSYILVPGDKIQIHVLGQSDLSLEAQISDLGTIIYPLLGEVSVAGLSRLEAEQTILEGLKGPYLVDPKVSVSIASYRQVFLQGEVSKPGPYPYSPGLSLRRAILNAGGFTELAAEGRLYVINEYEVDAEERRVDQSYILRPGDIVTIRASFF